MFVHGQDCSSNGTFVNNRKLGKGESALLNDKDKISLVMSVAPMAEQYFIYHKGHPCDQDIQCFETKRNDPLSLLSICESEDFVAGKAVVAAQRDVQMSKSRSSLAKWPTCKYTTADRCTLEDLECQICLSTLSSCVTIEPCGHNFCAICLSNYVSSQLESGAQMMCPLRCPDPERFVKNEMVRNLIDKKKRESRNSHLLTTEEEVDNLIDGLPVHTETVLDWMCMCW